MLVSAGFLLLTICVTSNSASSTAVTVLRKDYNSVPSRELLAANMKAILESMASLQAVHPRLHRLYGLLRKDLYPSAQNLQLHHVIDLGKALKSSHYDVNKLNRVFTTTTGWPSS